MTQPDVSTERVDAPTAGASVTPTWTGRWIEPVESAEMRSVQRPIHLLAVSFEAGEVRSARLRITAHGIYQAFLNGERIGDHELTPGFTSYRHRLQVQEFDVTALVRVGENVL